MVYEHEIPAGSKLYFGKSAKIKRDVEARASALLQEAGFEEIVTPLFSYHQSDYIDNKRLLIRISDERNNEISLRADTTADLIRIVTKRLGRSSATKKWFYIQPVVSYPTKESYQIGAEVIEGTFDEVVSIALKIVTALQLHPNLQLSNIRIPKILHEEFGVDLDAIRSLKIEKLLALDLPWMAKLLAVNTQEDLEELESFPSSIKRELERLKEAAKSVAYEQLLIAPLYYAELQYYDALLFRLFEGNETLSMGGTYTIQGVSASGFAIYTDSCIAKISKEDKV